MDDIRVIDLPQITDPVGATLLYAVTDYLGTPVEGFIADTDLGKFIGKIGKLNITQPATTATLAIANGKTLTASNTLTLAGTDGSTLNIGAGGTLGTAAYTAATAYEVPLTFSTGLTRIGNTITATGSGSVSSVGLVGTANQVTVTGTSPITSSGSWTLSIPALAQLSIAKVTNLTGNGFVKTSASDGTLSIDTATYLTSSTGVSSITGTTNQVIASAATGAVTLSLPQSINTTSTPQFTRLGIGSAADGTTPFRVMQASNGTTMFVGYRQTDSAPTGAFIDLKEAAGVTSVFTVGVTGVISVGTLPVGSVSGLGTGVATALAVNVGSAGAPVLFNGALGTPSSGTLTNATGLPAAGVVGTAAVLGANTFTGIQTITPAVNAKSLIVTGVTHTADSPILDLSQTWNNSGVTFTAAKINVTNTASASQSSVFDAQVGGVTQLSVKNRAVGIGTSAPFIDPNYFYMTIGKNAALFTGVLKLASTYNSGDGAEWYQDTSGVIRMGVNATTPVFALGLTAGLFVGLDATHTTTLRNSTNAQTFRVYGQFVDSSNGDWLNITKAAGGAATIGTAKNGTGVASTLVFQTASTTALTIGTDQSATFAGAIKASVPAQFISTGAAAVTGNATLVGGTVTVSTTAAVTASLILLTRKTSGGTIGTAITYTISNGVSFTINSDNILDTSTFSWVIVNTF